MKKLLVVAALLAAFGAGTVFADHRPGTFTDIRGFHCTVTPTGSPDSVATDCTNPSFVPQEGSIYTQRDSYHCSVDRYTSARMDYLDVFCLYGDGTETGHRFSIPNDW